jgi:predicted amidophosphoribosyltransferase
MRSARSMLAEIGARALEIEALALPRACLGCERPLSPLEQDAPCCALCLHRMRPLAPPACGRCGQPIDRWSLTLDVGSSAKPRRRAVVGSAQREAGPVACAFCREWPNELGWATSAVWLDDGPARNLVYALKYGGWRIAAAPMANRIRLYGGPRLRTLDALVPVPLGRARRRERGHNQAALLALALGGALGVPVLEGALRRTRETRTQTRLTPAERWRNVAGAFAADAGDVGGRRVALVDDVMTTGATLGAAAAALAALGPVSIGAVTFARALVPA